MADYIGEMLNAEFNTVCEDGSLEEVGSNLCIYFNQIKKGRDEEVLLELNKFKGSGVQQCKADTPSSELVEMDDSDDTNIDVSIPMSNLGIDNDTPKQLKNQPDEDGWVTISKSKKR